MEPLPVISLEYAPPESSARSFRVALWVCEALGLAVCAVAFVYFGAARLGLSLAFATQQVTAVWPPTGIALVALFVLGVRVWPGVFLAAVLVNATAKSSPAFPYSLGTPSRERA